MLSDKTTLLKESSLNNLDKWEYKILELPNKINEDYLNYVGHDGWELVAINYLGIYTYYFKRKIQTQ